MTDHETETSTGEPTPIWRYIPLDQYKAPKPSAREAVRKGFLGALERMPAVTWLLEKLRRNSESDAPVIAQDELHRLPEALFDQVVPVPDWTESLAALQQALRDWATTGSSNPHVQVVVGAPYSGAREIVTSWANSQGWTLVEPPTPEEILRGGQDWLTRLTEIHKATPVALPCLEGCYLRHHDGLKLIRQLIDWILTQRNPCLIGCSSWAWSYLGKALSTDALFPTPWSLEALNQERLQRWFTELATRQGKKTTVFRQSDSGDLVLLPPEHDSENAAETAESTPELSDFLVDLAAHSRGIPGVAWAIWRHSLRLAPDNTEEANEETPQSAATGHERTLWVKPWSHVKLPKLAAPPNRDELLVLHTVLLHESLSEQHLTPLLPLSSFAVLKLLNRLKNAGLLESSSGVWRVTPLGYPAVRQSLATEEYLVDQI